APPVAEDESGAAAAGVPARPEPRVAVASAAALPVEARDGVALAHPGRLVAEVVALVRAIERGDVVGVLEDADLALGLRASVLVLGGLLRARAGGGEAQGQGGQQRHPLDRLHASPLRDERPGFDTVYGGGKARV